MWFYTHFIGNVCHARKKSWRETNLNVPWSKFLPNRDKIKVRHFAERAYHFSLPQTFSYTFCKCSLQKATKLTLDYVCITNNDPVLLTPCPYWDTNTIFTPTWVFLSPCSNAKFLHHTLFQRNLDEVVQFKCFLCISRLLAAILR